MMKKESNITTIFFILIVFLTIISLYYLYANSFPINTIIVESKALRIQIASNYQTRKKGLSNIERNRYKYNGMLFIFSKNELHNFQSHEMKFILKICSLKYFKYNVFELEECFYFPPYQEIKIKGKYILEAPY